MALPPLVSSIMAWLLRLFLGHGLAPLYLPSREDVGKNGKKGQDTLKVNKKARMERFQDKKANLQVKALEESESWQNSHYNARKMNPLDF
ncbi:hypothetical protein HPP92_028507 [Vanilla planifolia]|uniref:Uncharacterized protein n=1 Tax=Vanilla planifolia TaxID=51239 RepID=A0A835P8X8_VANPL|nr:hypothetical protein HPP92_028507 [Vanilla planifolia]